MISSRLDYLATFVRYCRLSMLIAAVSFVARYVLHAIATPYVCGWIRPATMKPVFFRIIERLKPAYRDSYMTHGLSLGTHP